MLVVLGLTAGAVAADATPIPPPPARKVLVLPTDGDAETLVRKQLDVTLAKLAQHVGVTVTTGETTLTETAAAVGCEPAQPTCIDEVIATLAVDELVWGTATTTAGKTTFVVHRAVAKQPAQDLTIVLDSPPDANKTEADLGPLFGVAPAPPPPPPEAPVDRERRNLGIALAAGGGAMLLVGLVLWANAGSTQDAVDNHPTNTLEDFQDLDRLEGKVTTYAIVGDLLVLGGLAVGGYGGWILYEEHQTRVVVTPTTVPAGAGVQLGVRW